MRSLPPVTASNSPYKATSQRQSSPASTNAWLNATRCPSRSVSARVPSTSKINASSAMELSPKTRKTVIPAAPIRRVYTLTVATPGGFWYRFALIFLPPHPSGATLLQELKHAGQKKEGKGTIHLACHGHQTLRGEKGREVHEQETAGTFPCCAERVEKRTGRRDRPHRATDARCAGKSA